MRALVARFSHKLGREIRLGAIPRLIVKVMGAFVPLVREVDEMLYQWEEPFVVSDRQYRERFMQQSADTEAAAAATVAWAQEHYAIT
jgi:hypothetical protein